MRRDKKLFCMNFPSAGADLVIQTHYPKILHTCQYPEHVPENLHAIHADLTVVGEWKV